VTGCLTDLYSFEWILVLFSLYAFTTYLIVSVYGGDICYQRLPCSCSVHYATIVWWIDYQNRWNFVFTPVFQVTLRKIKKAKLYCNWGWKLRSALLGGVAEKQRVVVGLSKLKTSCLDFEIMATSGLGAIFKFRKRSNFRQNFCVDCFRPHQKGLNDSLGTMGSVQTPLYKLSSINQVVIWLIWTRVKNAGSRTWEKCFWKS